MYRVPTLIFLAVLTTLSACGDDDPIATTESGAVELAFVGTVAGEPLALESATYDAPGVAEGFRMSRLSFFLSEIELITETSDGELGTDVDVDVAYVELGPDGRDVIRLEDVPNGEYVGLRFNLGLTEEQDALQPRDFAADHPLAEPSEYWVDWGSYIFLKIEGRSDTLADGRAMFDQSFVYHIGRAAENTRRLELRMPITVAGTAVRAGVGLDVEELLGLRSNRPLSLVGAADHRNTAAERIMDNAGRAISQLD